MIRNSLQQAAQKPASFSKLHRCANIIQDRPCEPYYLLSRTTGGDGEAVRQQYRLATLASSRTPRMLQHAVHPSNISDHGTTTLSKVLPLRCRLPTLQPLNQLPPHLPLQLLRIIRNAHLMLLLFALALVLLARIRRWRVRILRVLRRDLGLCI
jgi:hypothetical protein